MVRVVALRPLELMGVVAVKVMILGIDRSLMEVKTLLHIALALNFVLASVFVVLNIHVSMVVVTLEIEQGAE